MTPLIACNWIVKQYLRISKTAKIFNDALQVLFGYLPCTSRTQRASNETVLVNFDEASKPNDNKADLLLGFSFQRGSRFSQDEQMTKQRGRAEGTIQLMRLLFLMIILILLIKKQTNSSRKLRNRVLSNKLLQILIIQHPTVPIEAK